MPEEVAKTRLSFTNTSVKVSMEGSSFINRSQSAAVTTLLSPELVRLSYADPSRSARLVIAAKLQIGNKTMSIITWNRSGFSWTNPSFLAT
jgi:hypothetical protein